MEKDNFKTKVIFRKFRSGGDIIAVFPELPGDNQGYLCVDYMHVGQHGSSDYSMILDITIPAKPEEYMDLFFELQNCYGYSLQVVKRISRKMFENRRANL